MRWVFSSSTLMSVMSKMARRSGKGPRLPGIAATQEFQKQAYVMLKM
jgi:hypothetical protein